MQKLVIVLLACFAGYSFFTGFNIKDVVDFVKQVKNDAPELVEESKIKDAVNDAVDKASDAVEKIDVDKAVDEAMEKVSATADKVKEKATETVKETTKTNKNKYDVFDTGYAEEDDIEPIEGGIKTPLKPGYGLYLNGSAVTPFTYKGKIGLCTGRDDLSIFEPAIYEDIYIENYAISGMILLKKDGKWGAIGYDSFIVDVPFIYDIIKPYKNGRAAAVLNGKSVVIDTKGNIVG